jgi:hypothetical protein
MWMKREASASADSPLGQLAAVCHILQRRRREGSPGEEEQECPERLDDDLIE